MPSLLYTALIWMAEASLTSPGLRSWHGRPSTKLRIATQWKAKCLCPFSCFDKPMGSPFHHSVQYVMSIYYAYMSSNLERECEEVKAVGHLILLLFSH